MEQIVEIILSTLQICCLHAVSVWSPCYNYATDKVESVQRKFTKRLRGCNNMDYSTRLDHLQLQSLERRRLIADLVLTYRIIFGLIDLSMSDYVAIVERL